MFSSGARIKPEETDDEYGEGAYGWPADRAEELRRTADLRARVRDTARRLAAEAGLGVQSGHRVSGSKRATSPRPETAPLHDGVASSRAVNKHGRAHVGVSPVPVKTPKYSGKADWEAFHAQFELLACAAGWSDENKALQLALCLTDDALACLLLLSPEEKSEYRALVGALRRRFGQCTQPGLLRSERGSRRRQPGEPLRALANDIESLARRAYACPRRCKTGQCGPLGFHPDALHHHRGATSPRSRYQHAAGAGSCGLDTVGDFCHIPVTVYGVPYSALIDTGSMATLVRPDIVPRGTQLEQTSVQLCTVTGDLAPMVGKGLFTLSVGGRSVRSSVWVARVQDPCILGLDFLRNTGAVLDLGNGTLSFQGGPTVGMLSPAHLDKQQLQPVKAAESNSVSTTPLGVCYASPAPLPHYLHSAPLNMCVKDYSLTKRRASPVRRSYPPATPAAHPSTSLGPIPLAQLPQMGEEERLSAVREIWRKNCDGLEPQQQEALWRLLLEFKDIFALTEEDVGQTHLVQHDIITGDAQPVKMRPRRLPLARQEAADKARWEMQQAGIIEPSDSPWASPVVMVPKKGGKWRFCIDYRRLNEKDKAFTWTGPCQEAFNSLQRALIEAPTLAPPDLSLPFVLDTDASNVDMGAVQAQVGPGGERVVAYYSRTFDKAERRYCITRRELLAVVLAIRHFKYYLCGLHFTVRTDHSALQWLMSFKEPEGQVARWIEELQSYHFSVAQGWGTPH
ncbi:hypothetical protein SKAU_G00016200 [Synaphobranchus kaupii]|uniref:Reverse transcriptase RNase H-like domain-containing protein n=1 Tax=Synaphobranchus kaupii TaxID=118154 RepID=A0A9Q1GB94_SYNKA|nr:hypothetical protein SKAU_G00016200 [Synaphobranchus kaupii]